MLVQSYLYAILDKLNYLRRYPSVVLTSAWASMRVCHFLTMDLNLSVVRLIPWKLVRQFLPWTSSQTNLNFLNDLSASYKHNCSIQHFSKYRSFKHIKKDIWIRAVNSINNIFKLQLSSQGTKFTSASPRPLGAETENLNPRIEAKAARNKTRRGLKPMNDSTLLMSTSENGSTVSSF